MTQENAATPTETSTSSTKPEAAPLAVRSLSDTQGIVRLTPSDTLPNHRPIAASNLVVRNVMRVAGSDRPITSSGFKVSSMIHDGGNRPVMASMLQVSEVYRVMGNRPVASNDIDDAATLMGFLD